MENMFKPLTFSKKYCIVLEIMSELYVKQVKKGGRPRSLTPEGELVCKLLYFDLGWKVREIRELIFPQLSEDTIRTIARRIRDSSVPWGGAA